MPFIHLIPISLVMLVMMAAMSLDSVLHNKSTTLKRILVGEALLLAGWGLIYSGGWFWLRLAPSAWADMDDIPGAVSVCLLAYSVLAINVGYDYLYLSKEERAFKRSVNRQTNHSDFRRRLPFTYLMKRILDGVPIEQRGAIHEYVSMMGEREHSGWNGVESFRSLAYRRKCDAVSSDDVLNYIEPVSEFLKMVEGSTLDTPLPSRMKRKIEKLIDRLRRLQGFLLSICGTIQCGAVPPETAVGEGEL